MVNVEPGTGRVDAAHDAGIEALPAGQADLAEEPAAAPIATAQAEVQNRLTHHALVDALSAQEIGYEVAPVDAEEQAHVRFRTLAKTVPALVREGGLTLEAEHGVVNRFITVLFDYHKIGIREEGLDGYDALQAYYNLIQAYRARYVGHYDEQAWLEQLEARLRDALVKQLDDPQHPTTVRVGNYSIEQLDGMIGLGQALRWNEVVPGAEDCVLSKLAGSMQEDFLDLFALGNTLDDETRAAMIETLKAVGERREIPLPVEALEASISEKAAQLRTAIDALEAQVEEERFYVAKTRAIKGGITLFNFRRLELRLALFPEIKVQSDEGEQTVKEFLDEMQKKVSEFSQRNFEHLLGKRLEQLQTAIGAIRIQGKEEESALDQAEKAFYDLDDIHYDEEPEERSVKRRQSAERLKECVERVLIPKITEHLRATIGKSLQETERIMQWGVDALMELRKNLMAYISHYLQS